MQIKNVLNGFWKTFVMDTAIKYIIFALSLFSTMLFLFNLKLKGKS